MADYSNKYVDSTGVKYLWDKANNTFLKQESGKVLSDNNFSDAEKEKLENLTNYELSVASSNTLGGIKIGDGLTIDQNGVVRTVYNPEMDVDWADIGNRPTSLEGYGILDAASKDELDEVMNELDTKIVEVRQELQNTASKVYKYKGKVTDYDTLTGIAAPENGDVYDVEEDGANYAWNDDESRWDNLGGMVKVESLSNLELDIITGSATSEAALKAIVANGGNADLENDLTITEPITVQEDVTLNLHGYTLTYTGSGYAFTADGARLTISGGEIEATKRIAQAENGGVINLSDGTFTSGDVAFTALGSTSKVIVGEANITGREGCIGAFDGGQIQIDGGTIIGENNSAVFTAHTSGRGGNTIVMNDGKIIGRMISSGYEACGVYIANNDTFTMNGGEIVAENGCGLLMRAGDVTINNGIITATGTPGTTGMIGDSNIEMSKSAVIYHESANYPGKAGMRLVINNGQFTGADHAVEIISNEETPNVSITGGTFTPELP